MFKIFCILFMIFPFYGLWSEGALTGFWFLILSVGILAVCGVQTITREGRTPIYEIFSRMVLTGYIPFLLAWWVVFEEAGDMTFWEATWYCFFGASIFVFVGYVIVMLGMGALGLIGEARAGGYHPYWDSLPAIWNPHGIFRRKGIPVSRHKTAAIPFSKPMPLKPMPLKPMPPGIPVKPRRN